MLSMQKLLTPDESVEEARRILSCNNIKKVFRNLNLTAFDFERADLESSKFYNCVLNHVAFWNVKLNNVDFFNCELTATGIANSTEIKSIVFSDCDLSFAYITNTKLIGAHFDYCILDHTQMQYSKIERTTFSKCNGRHTDFNYAVFDSSIFVQCAFSSLKTSGTSGYYNKNGWMAQFERDELGWIVYKRISNGSQRTTEFDIPEYWDIAPGNFIEETVNTEVFTECGCGVNFGTLDWCTKYYRRADLWKCRIRYEDAASIVVPENSTGKARCGRLELIEIVL